MLFDVNHGSWQFRRAVLSIGTVVAADSHSPHFRPIHMPGQMQGGWPVHGT